MSTTYSVKLKKVAEEFGLLALNLSSTYDEDVITTADVNRPAMQLTGFYSYFDPKRIQIIGRVESTYLDSLSSQERLACFRTFMSYDICALVICHGCEAFPECLMAAKEFDRNVFITDEDTSNFQSSIIFSLRKKVAPRITMHGVLVEIYGEGVLITGDSGIGKSETALELIKRGHRLIADDAVEIKYINKELVIGTAPEMIRYYMELRGVGVINVKHIYGVGAVKPESRIDLVVNMEKWDTEKMYDRLGLTNEYEEIFKVKIPKVTIPVEAGRNLAVILELAAMNNRQKKMGYNAAETLTYEHDSRIDAGGF